MNLSPTRLALLRDIADPLVTVYADIPRGRQTWSVAVTRVKRPGDPQRRVVTAAVRDLENAGLVELEPATVRYYVTRAWRVTPSGVEMLRAADTEP
jgi:hypothetical protein